MIALDTNILVYAITDDDARQRHVAACDLLDRIAHLRAIVPLQVVGEFLNVCKKRKQISYTAAIERGDKILQIYRCIGTTKPDYLRAAITSHRYRLQYFDALIVIVALRAGATVLFSEDMQDGVQVEGLTIVDPFNPENADLIESLCTASG